MDRGEKSESVRKNESGDEEKPLKKARYVWELKGKRHLRNSSGLPCSNDSPSTSQNESEEGVGAEPLEKQGPVSSQSVSPSKNCCLETFLAKTEDIMDRDSSDDDESQKLPLENSIEEEIAVTLVSVQPKNQDYYLRKWQARQIARGFVDNTINSMLENWVDRPLDAFDAANFVENCDNDGQVEDDAILMAIQSHGLQSGWRRGQNSGSNSSVTNSTFNSNSNSSFNSNIAMAGSSRSDSRTETLASNSIHQDSSLDNYENLQKEQENESSVASSSSSMSVDTVSSISNPYEGELGDPMDFLNAAVSVAIQKKGLTYG